jgi:hypothetical protein
MSNVSGRSTRMPFSIKVKKMPSTASLQITMKKTSFSSVKAETSKLLMELKRKPSDKSTSSPKTYPPSA